MVCPRPQLPKHVRRVSSFHSYKEQTWGGRPDLIQSLLVQGEESRKKVSWAKASICKSKEHSRHNIYSAQFRPHSIQGKTLGKPNTQIHWFGGLTIEQTHTYAPRSCVRMSQNQAPCPRHPTYRSPRRKEKSKHCEGRHLSLETSSRFVLSSCSAASCHFRPNVQLATKTRILPQRNMARLLLCFYSMTQFVATSLVYWSKCFRGTSPWIWASKAVI